jgi:hypothetical protein
MPGTNREPPPPPAAAVPVADADIIAVDADLIDVVIGADEERAHVNQRRREHSPPEEEGVPRGRDVAHEIISTIEDEQQGGGGVVVDLATADTVRYGEGEEDRRLRELRQSRRSKKR